MEAKSETQVHVPTVKSWTSWAWVSDPARGPGGYHAHVMNHYRTTKNAQESLRVVKSMVRFIEQFEPWWHLFSATVGIHLLLAWLAQLQVSPSTAMTYLRAVKLFLEWSVYYFEAHEQWCYDPQTIIGLKALVANQQKGLQHQAAPRPREFPTYEELLQGTQRAIDDFFDLADSADPERLLRCSQLAMWITHFSSGAGLRPQNMELLTVDQAELLSHGEVALQTKFKTSATYGVLGISVNELAQRVLHKYLRTVRPLIVRSPTDAAFVSPFAKNHENSIKMRSVCSVISKHYMHRTVLPSDLRYVIAARMEQAVQDELITEAEADAAAISRGHSRSVARRSYAAKVLALETQEASQRIK